MKLTDDKIIYPILILALIVWYLYAKHKHLESSNSIIYIPSSQQSIQQPIPQKAEFLDPKKYLDTDNGHIIIELQP